MQNKNIYNITYLIEVYMVNGKSFSFKERCRVHADTLEEGLSSLYMDITDSLSNDKQINVANSKVTKGFIIFDKSNVNWIDVNVWEVKVWENK